MDRMQRGRFGGHAHVQIYTARAHRASLDDCYDRWATLPTPPFLRRKRSSRLPNLRASARYARFKEAQAKPRSTPEPKREAAWKLGRIWRRQFATWLADKEPAAGAAAVLDHAL